MTLTTCILTCLAAAFVSALATPLVRRMALRWGAVSAPGGRNVNRGSVPRLGGVAMTLALVVALVGAAALDKDARATLYGDRERAIALAVGTLILFVVGVRDDTKGMRSLHKLYAQLAAAFLAYAGGFRIEAVHLPIVGDLPMGVFALPVTTLWIVGIINAINLIDGLDGLAAGVVFFAAFTDFVVARLTDNAFTGIITAAFLGSVLGFLFFNFNPARIFMGDSGSYVLGFVLACASLIGTAQKASTTVSILVPVLALGVPILDTLFSIVRRMLEQRPIFSPDRGHLHHRLLDLGITHRRAVLILYGVSVALTLSALAVAMGRSWQAGAAIAGATIVLLGLVRFVGIFEYLHLRRRQRARIRSRHTELLRRLTPQLVAELASTRSEDDVWARLAHLVEEGDLVALELVPTGGSEAEKAWVRSGIDASQLVQSVSARFPAGEGALYDLRFRWQSEFGDVSPQTEILLQVVVDSAVEALAAHSSGYVRTAAPAPLPGGDRASASFGREATARP